MPSSLLRTSARLAAWSLAAAWLYKAVSSSRGLRRVPRLDLTLHASSTSVAVIVPARDEQAGIAACVTSLLAQNHPHLRVIAVDDRSSDHTGPILDQLAQAHPGRLSVLHITSLPPGWTGKAHAMALAARHARSVSAPGWLLFTDADVLFHPDAIGSSLARAEAVHADHFVTLPTAILRTRGEAALMGFLQVMGLWATRLWRVADQRARDAVGVGAFNLLRTSAYDRIGGFASLRLQILEDLTLARRVRTFGLRQRVAFAPGLVTVHWAPGWRGILSTMTKNLFAIFRYRLILVGLGSAALLVLCLGPFAALAWRRTRLPGLVALGAIVVLYRESHRFSRISSWTVLAFAPGAVLFVFAIARSAVTTLRHGGVTWRGTFYPLAQLRAEVERI